jgi:hypothetical protein
MAVVLHGEWGLCDSFNCLSIAFIDLGQMFRTRLMFVFGLSRISSNQSCGYTGEDGFEIAMP